MILDAQHPTSLGQGEYSLRLTRVARSSDFLSLPRDCGWSALPL
jgi:hypothetical protein